MIKFSLRNSTDFNFLHEPKHLFCIYFNLDWTIKYSIEEKVNELFFKVVIFELFSNSTVFNELVNSKEELSKISTFFGIKIFVFVEELNNFWLINFSSQFL